MLYQKERARQLPSIPRTLSALPHDSRTSEAGGTCTTTPSGSVRLNTGALTLTHQILDFKFHTTSLRAVALFFEKADTGKFTYIHRPRGLTLLYPMAKTRTVTTAIATK